PDPAVAPQQAMAALAVGVVHCEVEERDPTELVGVGVLEREVVVFGIEIDEELDRAHPLRPIAQHRGRYIGPPERSRHLVRRDLATTERPLREIPQWRL